MAVRRRIGAALQGFADAFGPLYQQQQYMDRMGRSEERADAAAERQLERDLYGDIGSLREQIRTQYLTPEQAQARLTGLAGVHGDLLTDEMQQDVLGSVLSGSERVGDLYAALPDVSRPFMTPQGIAARGAPYGLSPEDFEMAQTSIPGGADVGFVGEGPSPVGYPLSFVDEPAFGGPLAEQIRASQAGEQAALKSRADWEQEVMDEATRARLMIEEEVAAENFSAQTLREAERIKMLSPFQQEAQLSSLREELRVRREDEMTTLRDPEYRRLTLKMAENLAKMQALVTDRPQFFDRLDPDTGDVSTTMLYRDPTTGFMKFQSMTGVFPGVPWSAYQAGEVSDPVAQLMRTMSQEGWDVTTPEGASEFTRKASALQVPPDQAGAALDNIQQVISGGQLPGSDAVEEIFPGGVVDEPETSDEALDVYIRGTLIPELLNQLAPAQAALANVDPTSPEFGARSAQFNALREEIAQLHQALGGDAASRGDLAFRHRMRIPQAW